MLKEHIKQYKPNELVDPVVQSETLPGEQIHDHPLLRRTCKSLRNTN